VYHDDTTAILPNTLVRYARPPSAVVITLDQLQERIDVQQNASRLTNHVLTTSRRQGTRRGSAGSLSRGLMFGAAASLSDAMDGASSAVSTDGPLNQSKAPLLPHYPRAGDITGDDIERCLAVEHAVRKDSMWFGGIIGEMGSGGRENSAEREPSASPKGERRLGSFVMHRDRSGAERRPPSRGDDDVVPQDLIDML
jgi:hypothetical protein